MKQVKDVFETSYSNWFFRCGIALLVTTTWIVDQAVAQQRVDPALRARLDREFAEAHPQPGDYLPYLWLRKLNPSPSKSQKEEESKEYNLRNASQGDLTLVLTASLTCPKTRRHLPEIHELKNKFKTLLNITIVYVVEAHPEKDVCPYLGVVDVTEANLQDNILYRQPRSMEERIAIAEEFQMRYPIDGAVLVDSMNNVAWRTLGQSPNMALLVDRDKRVLLRQGWVEPNTLEEAIVMHLRKRPSSEIRMDVSGANNAELGQRGRGSFRVNDKKVNPEIMTILKRLSPDNPNYGDFVRWLEKVDSEKLRLLLQRFPSIINEKLTFFGIHSNRDTTILQIMIERNDLEKVKIACEALANVNLATGTDTPLSAAVRLNNFAIVEYLILIGADVRKCPLRQFDSLLQFAAWNGRKEIGQRLVDAGLKHDIFSESGLGLIEALTKRIDASPSVGLSFDASGNLALSYAVSGNQLQVVKLLLERKLAISSAHLPMGDALALAVKHEDTTMLETLLQNGFSPNHLAFDEAFREDRYKHFKLLMSAGADLSFHHRGQYPLHVAISRGLPLAFVEDLIARGEDINKLTIVFRRADDDCGPPGRPQATRETPLHIAARTRSPECVRLLLSKKAKNAELDQSELTPLAAAILETLSASEAESARGLETIKALVDGGCPKDAKDSKGHIIVDELEKIVRQLDLDEPMSKKVPIDELRRFRTRKFDELVGFDSTQLTSNSLLKKILECLK